MTDWIPLPQMRKIIYDRTRNCITAARWKPLPANNPTRTKGDFRCGGVFDIIKFCKCYGDEEEERELAELVDHLNRSGSWLRNTGVES